MQGLLLVLVVSCAYSAFGAIIPDIDDLNAANIIDEAKEAALCLNKNGVLDLCLLADIEAGQDSLLDANIDTLDVDLLGTDVAEVDAIVVVGGDDLVDADVDADVDLLGLNVADADVKAIVTLSEDSLVGVDLNEVDVEVLDGVVAVSTGPSTVDVLNGKSIADVQLHDVTVGLGGVPLTDLNVGATVGGPGGLVELDLGTDLHGVLPFDIGVTVEVLGEKGLLSIAPSDIDLTQVIGTVDGYISAATGVDGVLTGAIGADGSQVGQVLSGVTSGNGIVKSLGGFLGGLFG